MGCSISGLNALSDFNGKRDVWINDNRFRIIRQLGEDGNTSVFLVKETLPFDPSNPGLSKRFKDPSFVSDDGTYAMKKLIIQTHKHLDSVREEIRVSSLFIHPNILPLLDHSIILVKESKDESFTNEAYLLFPVHFDGTLLDSLTIKKAKKKFFSTSDVLRIFRQLCAGLEHMHNFETPYAHNGVKPGNVLLTQRTGQPPLAILMDLGSARPARKQIRSPEEAVQLQKWASEHCSAPYRAPELWDCQSDTEIDERTDIWSLGCTLFAIMYGTSPFEYALEESSESLQLAIVNVQIKWPTGPNPPYPDALHQFVKWMLQPQTVVRPHINHIIIHIDKLISKFSKGGVLC